MSVNLHELAATELTTARQRSLDLLEPLDDTALVRQHSPLMSPLVWDLAHVGNYEDMWLVRALGHEGVAPHLDDLYNAFLQPRATRPQLPLLGPADARSYIADVRQRALDALTGVSFETDDQLLRHAFVYGMVVQHEHQHDETMLATLQLMGSDPPNVGWLATDIVPFPPNIGSAAQVLIDGGPFIMGTDTDPWAYDNERPAIEVTVDPFWIDTTPVTNRAYLEFIDDGGYDDPRWWTPDGWAWRQEAGLEHPQFWQRERSSWVRRRFGASELLALDEPVQHVCWYEADAYARWRGMRLPTEIEWEKAASWDPLTERKRRFPWGDDPPEARHANLGHRLLGPAPVGAYPEGVSAYGVHHLLGDVWEWTASDFVSYPGFQSFPYREYSEVFFGTEYKVLRGGSWATHPTAVRTTFRNWDFPIRRQIFAGFRCARDV